MATETLRPSAAGDEETIDHEVGDGIGTHYVTVNEETPDGLTACVYAIQGDDGRDLYELPDPSPSGTIYKVTVFIHCFDNGYPHGYAQTVIKTENTPYEGDEVTLDSDWTTYSTEYLLNPNTSEAWTWTQISALQAGVALRCTATGTKRALCTQVYVEVDYAPHLPVADGDLIGIGIIRKN